MLQNLANYSAIYLWISMICKLIDTKCNFNKKYSSHLKVSRNASKISVDTPFFRKNCIRCFWDEKFTPSLRFPKVRFLVGTYPFKFPPASPQFGTFQTNYCKIPNQPWILRAFWRDSLLIPTISSGNYPQSWFGHKKNYPKTPRVS